MPIASARNTCVPDGGHKCIPILQALSDALCFQGLHHKLREALNFCPTHAWILSPSEVHRFGNRIVHVPNQLPMNVQSCILKAFAATRHVFPLASIAQTKVSVTFKQVLEQEASSGDPPRACDLTAMIKVNWFPAVSEILSHAKVFNRMCWLKTISNAWHTTTRMHEDVIWPCIFGCNDCVDNLMHY